MPAEGESHKQSGGELDDSHVYVRKAMYDGNLHDTVCKEEKGVQT